MNNDLISREALREQFDNYKYFYSSFEKMTVAEFLTIVHEFIDNAPTVSFSNLTTSDIDELCRLRSDLKSGLHVGSTLRTQTQIDKFVGVLDKVIDNAPTVEPDNEYGAIQYSNGFNDGFTTAKDTIIQNIAKQYSEHNELVPIWLSIGDLKGGAK